MLCFAGFTPVAKVDHATGDRAGNVVRNLRYEPSARRREEVGNLPCSMNFSTSLGSSPSMPRKIIFRNCAPRQGWRRGAKSHPQRGGPSGEERTINAETQKRREEREGDSSSVEKLRPAGSAVLAPEMPGMGSELRPDYIQKFKT